MSSAVVSSCFSHHLLLHRSLSRLCLSTLSLYLCVWACPCLRSASRSLSVLSLCQSLSVVCCGCPSDCASLLLTRPLVFLSVLLRDIFHVSNVLADWIAGESNYSNNVQVGRRTETRSYVMFNDEVGYGSVSVFPPKSQRRSNPFAVYEVSKLTFYAEAVHNVKVSNCVFDQISSVIYLPSFLSLHRQGYRTSHSPPI